MWWRKRRPQGPRWIEDIVDDKRSSVQLFFRNEQRLGTREGRRYATRVARLGHELALGTQEFTGESLEEITARFTPALIAAAEVHFLEMRKDGKDFYMAHSAEVALHSSAAWYQQPETVPWFIERKYNSGSIEPPKDSEANFVRIVALMHDGPEHIGKRARNEHKPLTRKQAVEQQLSSFLAYAKKYERIDALREALVLVTPEPGEPRQEAIARIVAVKDPFIRAASLVVEMYDRAYNSEDNGNFSVEDRINNLLKNRVLAYGVRSVIDEPRHHKALGLPFSDRHVGLNMTFAAHDVPRSYIAMLTAFEYLMQTSRGELKAIHGKIQAGAEALAALQEQSRTANVYLTHRFDELDRLVSAEHPQHGRTPQDRNDQLANLLKSSYHKKPAKHEFAQAAYYGIEGIFSQRLGTPFSPGEDAVGPFFSQAATILAAYADYAYLSREFSKLADINRRLKMPNHNI